MPDRREHRGPHPEDAELFAPAQVPALITAVGDLSWLLTRGYADAAAAKVVGDRYQLTRRQRVAVRRCACTDAQRDGRRSSRVPMTSLRGEHVAVDGFNVLLTIEAALAGGVILGARDGCRRDLASMHGSWKRVAETARAIDLVLDVLAATAPAAVTFVLDRPVANSGRLAATIRDAVAILGLACTVELHDAADRAVLASGTVVATADSAILDRAAKWVDLPGPILGRLTPRPWFVDLAGA